MKIGYPCINRSIGCQGNKTFRLKSYSENRLIETITNNLNCLSAMLQYNVEHGLLFFRISSELIPFASHAICTYDWKAHFSGQFKKIGRFIKCSKIRISMHPDQFVLINSPRKEIIQNSIEELYYHANVLDAMELDMTAKIQIHIGGIYGNKDKAISDFVQQYKLLDHVIKRRLCIENDDRLFSLKDCLKVHQSTGIPILFDSYHHEIENNGESLAEALNLAARTWQKKDGFAMVDYSSQRRQARKGSHAQSIYLKHFRKFLKETNGIDFDLMLEIKDKEKSALKAAQVLKEDPRYKNHLTGGKR